MNKYFSNHIKREQKKKKYPHQAWKQKKAFNRNSGDKLLFSLFFHTKQAHLTIMGHKIKDYGNLPI